MTCWIGYYHQPFGVIPPLAILGALLAFAACVAIAVKRSPAFSPARLWVPFAFVGGSAIGLAISYDAFERCPGDGAWIAVALASCGAYVVVLSVIGASYSTLIRKLAVRIPRFSATALAFTGSLIMFAGLLLGRWLLLLTYV